jgi:uncharacterized OB-fold protein
MTTNPKARIEEIEGSRVVTNVDPLIVKEHYEINYLHSYGQDSEFFRQLGKGKLMGSRCRKCEYVYATPRGHCMFCGSETQWHELPLEGKIHTYTTCYSGSESFLNEVPFHLVMVEFEGVNSLFMGRLIGADEEDIEIGMKVKVKFRRNLQFSATDVYFVPDAP